MLAAAAVEGSKHADALHPLGMPAGAADPARAAARPQQLDLRVAETAELGPRPVVLHLSLFDRRVVEVKARGDRRGPPLIGRVSQDEARDGLHLVALDAEPMAAQGVLRLHERFAQRHVLGGRCPLEGQIARNALLLVAALASKDYGLVAERKHVSHHAVLGARLDNGSGHEALPRWLPRCRRCCMLFKAARYAGNVATAVARARDDLDAGRVELLELA